MAGAVAPVAGRNPRHLRAARGSFVQALDIYAPLKDFRGEPANDPKNIVYNQLAISIVGPYVRVLCWRG
jgi:hypothetical protein